MALRVVRGHESLVRRLEATFAVLWLATAACEPATPPPPEVECGPRIDRMREVLTSPYDAPTAPPEMPRWVADAYKTFRGSSEPFARAKVLDDAVAKTIHGCYGIADAFYAAGNAPAGSRRAAMAKAVPAALESCDCRGVDVESLGFLLRLSPAP